MSSYPTIKMHTCSEFVNDVDFIDIDYSVIRLFNIPTITVNLDVDANTFVSNVTITTARINFSSKFTGNVRYTVISVK